MVFTALKGTRVSCPRAQPLVCEAKRGTMSLLGSSFLSQLQAYSLYSLSSVDLSEKYFEFVNNQ